jgi:hypothetical protein
MTNECTNLNRDEAKIVREIHELCMAYMHQPRPVILDAQKFKVLFELMACKSAGAVLHQLHYNKNHYNPYAREVTGTTVLSTTDAPPLLWYLFFILTTLTFPLSVPALMLYSWRTRGTINFLKTDGTLLVEKITVLCNEAKELIAAHPDKKAPLPTYQLSTRIKYTNNKAPDTNQWLNNQVSINPPTDPNAAPFATMTNALGQFGVSVFQNMALYHLENDAGIPVITSYRVNPKESETSQQFSIDIRSKFMWTYAASMRTRIALFTKFTLPPNFQSEQPDPLIAPNMPSTKNNWLTFSFLYKKESLEDLINKAGSTHDIDRKEDFLLQALGIAKNPSEQTKALEALFNIYGDYYDASNSDYIRSGRTDSMLIEICMPRAELKMHQYSWKLPPNFRSLTASALKLESNYQEICALAPSNIEAAWAKYQALPVLTPFIKRFFPNLEAMQYQLKILFTLSRHVGSPLTGAIKIGQFLPEHWLIAQVLSDFKKMLALIHTFDPVLEQQIQTLSVAPIQELVAAGEVAKKQTNLAVRHEIQQQEEALIWGELSRKNEDFTYRRLNENVDDDDLELLDTPSAAPI